MKIVINDCFGGFSVSKAVYDELGFKWEGYGYPDNEDFDIEDDNYLAYRKDPRLIAAIEKIGVEKASGKHANIRIVDVPDGIEWNIDNYDGMETIHEVHRSWQ